MDRCSNVTLSGNFIGILSNKLKIIQNTMKTTKLYVNIDNLFIVIKQQYFSPLFSLCECECSLKIVL